MARITQQTGSALPTRRYGSFAGKSAGSSLPKPLYVSLIRRRQRRAPSR
jgi:hypothetical protein